MIALGDGMFAFGLTGWVKYAVVTAAALALVISALVGSGIWQPSSSVNDAATDMAAVATTATDGNVITVPAAQAPRESAQTRNSSTRNNGQKPAQRRTFGFHYLDILEWLFADKRDSAHPSQPRNPGNTFSG